MKIEVKPFGTSASKFEKMMWEQASASLEKAIIDCVGNEICKEHNEGPRIIISGIASNINTEVIACCDAFKKRIYDALN